MFSGGARLCKLCRLSLSLPSIFFSAEVKHELGSLFVVTAADSFGVEGFGPASCLARRVSSSGAPFEATAAGLDHIGQQRVSGPLRVCYVQETVVAKQVEMSKRERKFASRSTVAEGR